MLVYEFNSGSNSKFSCVSQTILRCRLMPISERNKESPMNPQIHIINKMVYSENFQPTPAEQATNVNYEREGDISKPEMVNRDIEDPKKRQLIPLGEGNICVS